MRQPYSEGSKPHYVRQLSSVRKFFLVRLFISKFASLCSTILELQMVPHFGLWFLTGMPAVPVTISVSAFTIIFEPFMVPMFCYKISKLKA